MHFFTVVCTVIKVMSVYELFIQQLTEFPSILDSFSSILKCLHRDGRLGVVGSHGSGGETTCEEVIPPNGLK